MEINSKAVDYLVVSEDFKEQRLDNFLITHLKGVPKSYIYRIVRSGEVRVNSKRIPPDYRLQIGDRVRIPPTRQGQPTTKTVPAATFPVLYEDDAILVIDKPAGMAVHGGSGVDFGVIEQLRQAYPSTQFLELAHRLDRETSGVLLLAKKRSALLALHNMLREQAMQKTYWAFVKGKWRDEKRLVQLPLLKYLIGNGERRVRVDNTGLSSATLFYRTAAWSNLVNADGKELSTSLLQAELITGRTHQIRVHLSHLGFPIAGDEKYGDFVWNKSLAQSGLKRMFLHATTIKFDHPLTQQTMTIKAPLPPQLASWLDKLPQPSIIAQQDSYRLPYPACPAPG